jgi:hypothetical protein
MDAWRLKSKSESWATFLHACLLSVCMHVCLMSVFLLQYVLYPYCFVRTKHRKVFDFLLCVVIRVIILIIRATKTVTPLHPKNRKLAHFNSLPKKIFKIRPSNVSDDMILILYLEIFCLYSYKLLGINVYYPGLCIRQKYWNMIRLSACVQWWCVKVIRGIQIDGTCRTHPYVLLGTRAMK